MNLKSLYYFKELTTDMNMTKTANRLFISQQTLSNHILRLEEYYGVKLFDRSHKLSLTNAGSYLLTFATDVLRKEKELQDIFVDIKNQSKGLFRFGASPLRTELTLPYILPQFSEQYPDIEISLTTENSVSLQNRVLKGDLDLAMIVYRHPHPAIDASLIYRDQIYLCIPRSLIQKHYPTKWNLLIERSRQGASVSNFSKLSYLLPSTENLLGEVASQCFQEAAYAPKIYMTYKYASLASTIAHHQLAACFMTSMHLSSIRNQLANDLCIFPLLYKRQWVYHDLHLITIKNKYLPQYIKHFTFLLKDYFQSISKIKF